MNIVPVRPEAKPETDDTEATIRERLATIEQDAKSAVDAREALAAIRKNLNSLRVTRILRAVAYRDGGFLRLLSLHPDRASAHEG
jgi:hypothetical protein